MGIWEFQVKLAFLPYTKSTMRVLCNICLFTSPKMVEIPRMILLEKYIESSTINPIRRQIVGSWLSRINWYKRWPNTSGSLDQLVLESPHSQASASGCLSMVWILVDCFCGRRLFFPGIELEHNITWRSYIHGLKLIPQRTSTKLSHPHRFTQMDSEFVRLLSPRQRIGSTSGHKHL